MENAQLIDRWMHHCIRHCTASQARGESQRHPPENYQATHVQLQGLRNGRFFSLLASLTPAGTNNPQYTGELDCWQNIAFAPLKLYSQLIICTNDHKEYLIWKD